MPKQKVYALEDSLGVDLILVRNNKNISMSGVVDPLIQEQVRYHCPVMVLLKLTPSVLLHSRENLVQ